MQSQAVLMTTEQSNFDSHYLGHNYNSQGVAKDYADAVKWYRKAAEQGMAYAQCNLGAMYENGRGIAKDYADAVKWYRKAAEQGDAEAKEALERINQNR